ncbi:tRNA 4-thiouridine(8) synthase ThiI [Candidatus Micrarchaeota archaeon]|nr:tRNA 4-thiouridine(8) synthase ThiI [Candidatus Micrarchaeota archaeon]
MLISISFSEVTTKGGNRRLFENQLVRNALASLAPLGSFRAQKRGGRILFSSEKEPDGDAVKRALTRTFGIDSITISIPAKPDIKDIESVVLANSADLIKHSIRVEAKRSDKGFPLTSQQINEQVGAALVKAGCTVDLENPEKTIFIDVLESEVLISFERIKGPGGLPVGSSGKMISLLSGGIDSPVSSWLMMKRGCEVDFLHLHQFPENKDVGKSKMVRILRTLREYSPKKLRMFAVPYTEFYKKTLSMEPRNELVVFRRFIIHLANRLAKEHGYHGIITGDSIGQVASQTAENLLATDEASQLPVYRPLIGFNKQEIVDLAMKIGTFDISIEPYKDCCSLVAHKSPCTRVPLHIAKKMEDEIRIDEVVEKSLKDMEIIEI